VGLASTTPPPVAVTSGVSLADLEREQQARQQWVGWQQRMQADFDRIAAFQGAVDLRVQAWQRFIGAWADNNPTSNDDERLRDQAQQRLAAAESELQQQRIASASPQASSGTSPMTTMASPGQTFKDCAECPEMVAIPAGRFLMGSPPGEAGRLNNEGPQRWVDVPRFALGKYEVTQGEWLAVMGSNPSHFSRCGMNCPVENVSWNDAQEYVRRLSQRTGQSYRLPSEAEWEYAARAGTTTAYFWGDLFDGGRANNGANTVAVGRFRANAFGLHDMHGNVWEWVQDVWHDNYIDAPTDGSSRMTTMGVRVPPGFVLIDAPTDGSSLMTGGDSSRRVLRGGSWGGTPQGLRSAIRYRSAPGNRVGIIGFRIARTF
jgi:formylglycine-generating enzyme required for sulfatase activity